MVGTGWFALVVNRSGSESSLSSRESSLSSSESSSSESSGKKTGGLGKANDERPS